MRKMMLVVLVLAALIVAGCGGGSHKTPTTVLSKAVPPAQLAKACPPSGGSMGCSIAPPPAGFKLPALSVPVGCKIPDQYEGNTGINYFAAKPHICGAIVKAGESSTHVDSAYTSRLATLRQLHIWHAPYWFVRGGSCTAEGAKLIAVLRANGGLDSGPVILDMEVPSAVGMAPCLTSQIEAAFHRVPVIYTAPGTWPGGSSGGLPAWVAAYGPSHAPCVPWTCKPVAWQFADGSFARYFIAGIGYGDVSVDYGITKLVPAPPVDPFAIFPKHRYTLTRGVAGFPGIRASEYNTVKRWTLAKCQHPTRRLVCRTSQHNAALLRDRDWFISHHSADLKRTVSPPRWSFNRIGSRFAVLSKIAKR